LICIGKAGKAKPFAQSLGLTEEDVEFIDLMPKSFVIDQYQDSDVLVMLLDNTPWNKAKYTSKIFDLLAARRPILACVPTDSLAAQVIRSSKVGITVENENPEEIADAILDLYRQYEEVSVAEIYNLDAKLQFEREKLVDKLEACLMNAVSQPQL
jgi:glycosyltransferase involved in cell wall biosynthesis